jgi:hypothetical protein
MAYRHLMPIVVVVALLAGAMGAFLGFLLTDGGDEQEARVAELEARTAELETSPGVVIGKSTVATRTSFSVSRGREVSKTVSHADSCEPETVVLESLIRRSECVLTVSGVGGQPAEIPVSGDCFSRIRVGEPWPSELEECR